MRIWLWFMCLSPAILLTGAEPTLLDPLQPYSAERFNPVTYDAELVVAVTAPYKTKLLKVWMPIPPSDRGQELLSSDVTTFPDEVTARVSSEPVFGNRFAYFEFSNPQGAQILRHKLRIRVWELRWQLDAQQVQSATNWPDSFAQYRRSEGQAVVADARFEKLLQEIVPLRRGPLSDLAAVMTWADRNLTYDHNRASLAASSVHALELRAGHCSDYHGFCAALGRLMNQPTRVTYGINTFPKSSPSHCKFEAFLPPYGWVSFDVSETQKLGQLIRTNTAISNQDREQLLQAAHHRLIHGFRDNTWLAQTRGTDYELSPAATSRVPVVRTIYAEADGKPLPDPDPSSGEQSKFAWMTAYKFTADVRAQYPFTSIESLREWTAANPKLNSTNSGD